MISFIPFQVSLLAASAVIVVAALGWKIKRK